MKKGYYFLISLFLLIQVSCQQNTRNVITEKIQYDVNIMSPDPEYDWWIQNLVGPQREKLVNVIIEGAKDGTWQAYDYYNNPINAQEVRSIFSDTMVITMARTTPPYDLYDSLIIYTILPEDIIRLRFMEEWSINYDNLDFNKKILGMAPIAKRIDASGTVRWQPLFWVYTDENFIKGIKEN